MRYCIAAIMLIASPALAWSNLDRMKFASSLGSVLAAEQPCGFSFNQAAIADLIEKSVPADDMQFAGMLSSMTSGHEFTLKDMSESEKTAYCAQTSRVARQYGLIN